MFENSFHPNIVQVQIICNFRPTMRSLSSFIILCFVSTINGNPYGEKVWSQNQTFSVFIMRPFVVNAEIRFMVEVAESYRSRATSYEYRFKFDQFPQLDKTIVSHESMTTYAVKFASTCESKGGNYTVQVDVWKLQLGVQTHSIGTILYTMEVTACDWIYIEHDGPVTLDLPITFTVNNRYTTDDPSYEYRFKFDQFPQHDKTIVSTSQAVYSVTFDSSSTPKAGTYTVKVDVWHCRHDVPSYLLGTVHRTFELSDSLIGIIDKNQSVNSDSLRKNIVTTARLVVLTAYIFDSTEYFTGRYVVPPANITYKWIINDEQQEESDSVIEHTFSQPQLNNISVIVTATKTNGSRLIQKSGTFKLTLKSKDPITDLTVDGPTEVKVFEKLQLDFKIHGGTPPFHYRYRLSMEEPYIENESVEKDTNDSFFSISNYFSEKGTRSLYLFLENDVSIIRQIFNISVY
ncbi:transmembrane protein 130-like [Tetranychus urticae]|uniref:transmembrane protein 130-like n=1 Tax=Tetranychus urticae TaxID=32264 RepID=UPI000D64DF9B|nr:transmembrane protein 130-like [Tetranychus urticae]